MLISSVRSKVIKISKQSILLDWKTSLKKTILSVAPGQGLIYIMALGLSKAKERTVHFKLQTGSTVMVHGIILGGAKDELAANIIVEHQKPRSTSRIILRGVFGGNSRGKLNGTIHIRKAGQQSDARLEERVLLLSPDAKAETIPNLEIEADDVKASHAATIARLSEEEIFYLQTRGFKKSEGIALLLDAFILSQLVHVPEGTERSSFEKMLQKKLSHIITNA
jgi:Fe-S cluster assembly protein SufD